MTLLLKLIEKKLITPSCSIFLSVTMKNKTGLKSAFLYAGISGPTVNTFNHSCLSTALGGTEEPRFFLTSSGGDGILE